MDLHQMLYYLEHKYCPEFFYKSPLRVMGIILKEQGAFFSDFVTEVYEKTPASIGLDTSEITCRLYMLPDKRLLILKIQLPLPAEDLECRHLYLLCDLACRHPLYMTSELAMNGGYYLCGWLSNGEHVNFGGIETRDPDMEYIRAISLYEALYSGRKS